MIDVFSLSANIFTFRSFVLPIATGSTKTCHLQILPSPGDAAGTAHGPRGSRKIAEFGRGTSCRMGAMAGKQGRQHDN